MNGISFSIAMVDDDEDDRIIIDEAFLQIGYGMEIKKFITGEALFQYLEKIEPNLYPSLIVIDNFVRRWESSDTVKRLKQNPRYRDIPVVIYTASVSPVEEAELKKLGVRACIEKASLMSEVTAVAEKLRDMAEAEKAKATRTS